MARAQTVKDYTNLTPEQVNRMSASELSKVVSQMASVANKRLKRLGATEEGKQSPAYQSAMERLYTTKDGGKFGVSGKSTNVNKLRNEYKAVRGFLTSKTGSIQGMNKQQKAVEKRIGSKFKSVTESKTFWSNYRKIMEQQGDMSGYYGSTELQQDLKKAMDSTNIKKFIKEINEKNVSEKRKNRDEYINKLTDDYYILNENHRRVKIDPTDNDDVLMIMMLKAGMQYEQKQGELHSEDDEGFVTLRKG